jgi:hypothetical protein
MVYAPFVETFNFAARLARALSTFAPCENLFRLFLLPFRIQRSPLRLARQEMRSISRTITL